MEFYLDADAPVFASRITDPATDEINAAFIPLVAPLTAIEGIGATPFVPFKSNSKGHGSPAWRRMWGMFLYRQDEFLAHYHARSNVEATFSAIKRKFGGAVRSKRLVTQVNEILCKVLCHNLTCLVQAMHALGISPTFGGATV